MTEVRERPRQHARTGRRQAFDGGQGGPPFLLRAVAFSVFFFPSSMVIAPMGAAGTVPLLLAAGLFVLWAASVAFGLHDPIPSRHPGRIAIGLLLLGSSASYVALYSGWSGGSTEAARSAADRWLILLLASASIVLICGETIRTVDNALLLVRSMLAGAFFCCLVAVVQFYFHVNPMQWVQLAMPGFTYNGGDTVFQVRGTFLRVAGSTFTSIELGVVSAMLLPLSVWRGMYDRTGRKWLHWTGTALLVFATAATISRSGVLGLLVGAVAFIPFLPTIARKWALVAVPAAVAALFLGIPGLISTLTGALTADGTDPSISTRTSNYPRVIEMLEARPVLGAGPGNYMPTNALHILDNQYLNAAVTMGLLGLICVAIYLLLPGVSTLHAARTARDPSLRSLAGAVAAGSLVGGVCSMSFDSLSFPVFALLYPMFVGLGGALWIMVKREGSEIAPDQTFRNADFSVSALKPGGF